MPVVTIASVDTKDQNNLMVDHSEDSTVYLQLNTEMLVKMKNDDTSFEALIKLIKEIVISSEIFCKL